MKINIDNNNESPRVEVVPLIDIIFCILTFFLLSGLQMARQQAINVDLPKAKSAESQTRQMMIVSLDQDGQVFVEQQRYPQVEALYQATKAYRANSPNGSIVLYASKQVRYERVMEILDLLRLAGGDNVALATTNIEASPTPAPVINLPPGYVPAPPQTQQAPNPNPSVLPLPPNAPTPRSKNPELR
jgi:biopolymer transport protein ExbD